MSSKIGHHSLSNENDGIESIRLLQAKVSRISRDRERKLIPLLLSPPLLTKMPPSKRGDRGQIPGRGPVCV